MASPFAIHEARLAVLEKRRDALELEIQSVKETIDLFMAREAAVQPALALPASAKAVKSA